MPRANLVLGGKEQVLLPEGVHGGVLCGHLDLHGVLQACSLQFLDLQKRKVHMLAKRKPYSYDAGRTAHERTATVVIIWQMQCKWALALDVMVAEKSCVRRSRGTDLRI